MGKRGPAAKGEFGDKSAVLSTRISADLRAALEKSVAQSGLTLSREIEHRLRRSFDDDKIANEGFGTRRNRALMKMIAISMQTAWTRTNRTLSGWMIRGCSIKLFRKSIFILMAVRPPGTEIQPADQKLRRKLEQVDPIERAADMWHFIQKADSSLPFGADPSDKIYNRLKAELGEIASRPEITEGTAKLAIKADARNRKI